MNKKTISDRKIGPKQFAAIGPQKGRTAGEQLDSCLLEFKKVLAASGSNARDVLKQTLFVRVEDDGDYFNKKDQFSAVLKDFYRDSLPLPPTSLVAQAPEGGQHVLLEAIILPGGGKGTEISRKLLGDIAYTVVRHAGFREVYAAGITGNREDVGTSNQAEAAFIRMGEVLGAEGMTFSNVVRQWNYIGDILGTSPGKEGVEQNYQVFNDVRSKYYDAAEFHSGYPAATGVGMKAGGVVLDFIAVEARSPEEIDIVPIKNPNQVDAYSYTQEVLVGDAAGEKAPPKFERAKVLSVNGSGQIFISGTAAVLGQNTISELDVEPQTRTTIGNISKLVSRENLRRFGFKLNGNMAPLSYLRAYVKYEGDVAGVRGICKKYFGDVPSLYVVADICRDDLLVELEGAVYVEWTR